MNEQKKMSKSDAPNMPMVITDGMRISSLESQVKYWELRYELTLKYCK